MVVMGKNEFDNLWCNDLERVVECCMLRFYRIK